MFHWKFHYDQVSTISEMKNIFYIIIQIYEAFWYKFIAVFGLDFNVLALSQ